MNILKKLFLLTLLSACTNLVLADELALNNSIGSNFVIDSKVFGEDRTLQVYLPEGYQYSSKKYPVMYIMDGDWYFLHGVSYQKSLKYVDRTPDYIVVGVNTDSDIYKRQSLFRSEKWKVTRTKFTNYLAKEVIPFIEEKFRVSEERLYFGWEIAGRLGAHIFTQHTELFNGYILASPTGFGKKNVIQKTLENKSIQNKFIYFTIAPVEKWGVEDLNKVAEILREKAPNNLKWQFDVLDGEDHYSTPNPSIYRGLKAFFADYAPIRFYSLKEFTDYGGLKPLYSHYHKRGVRYGISTDIHADTKHYLLMQSRKEGDIASFELFFNEFKGLFESYEEYATDSWAEMYGKSCLTYKKPDLAIAVFTTGLARNPNSSKLHNGLGDAYSMKEDYGKAAEYYQKAIDIAKEISDPELTKYEASLNGLSN